MSHRTYVGRLKSRRSFVPAARKLLDSLSEMDVRAAEWTNTKWDMEYSANALSLHAFIPKASSRPLGMGLPSRTAERGGLKGSLSGGPGTQGGPGVLNCQV